MSKKLINFHNLYHSPATLLDFLLSIPSNKLIQHTGPLLPFNRNSILRKISIIIKKRRAPKQLKNKRKNSKIRLSKKLFHRNKIMIYWLITLY